MDQLLDHIRTICRVLEEIVEAFRQTVRVLEKLSATISYVKDNKLSLVHFFPKKKVIYLGGQVGNQA